MELLPLYRNGSTVKKRFAVRLANINWTLKGYSSEGGSSKSVGVISPDSFDRLSLS